jgi:hypothetical protein
MNDIVSTFSLRVCFSGTRSDSLVGRWVFQSARQYVRSLIFCDFVFAVVVLTRCAVSQLRGNVPRRKNFHKEYSLTVMHHVGR